MKKYLTILTVLIFISFNSLNAQVYKRIIRLDSVGYYKNYRPYLHSSFSFKYPNTNVGNREEIRGILPYYNYPNNFYSFCKLHSQFMFNQMKDSINPYYDTVHNFNKTNTNFTINNYENISLKNNYITSYFNGIDTTAHFTYNNNQLISEDYSQHIFDYKKITYNYGNSNLLEKKETTVKNSNSRYFELFRYNGSGILEEKTDSFFDNNTLYLTHDVYKKWGNISITKHLNNSKNYDDSFYYNNHGLLDSVKSNFANSIKVYYYYDSHNYLDSVVYSRISSRDVVKLYWEIFTPSVSSFKQTYFNQSNDLNIYPNPSRGHLNIELKKGKTNLNIENVLGQVVKNMELSDETNSVDLSELPHGIYLLNFISYNEIRKIIIY